MAEGVIRHKASPEAQLYSIDPFEVAYPFEVAAREVVYPFKPWSER